MKIKSKNFRVQKGDKVKLQNWPTLVKPMYQSKSQYQEILEKQVGELCAQQELHYASNRYAILLIFQAMDAAGKDGIIKHVLAGINPQGCQVTSFKHPSTQELEHDYLWRTTQSLPERGRIGIFNRSYYEEVLIVRVHPEILLAENIPDSLLDKKMVWQERYHSILNFEQHLHQNGTRIIKIFLHLSKEEQRKRFIDRINDPKKNWKFTIEDFEERKFWKQYMQAYEDCLTATSTQYSPWHIVPADDKANARLIVSQIILDTFKSLKMTYPKPTAKHQLELQKVLHQLLTKAV
jgi:PPK2 family polyphosphate:nucleotide phosphotransferase